MFEPLTKKPFVVGSGPGRLVRVLAANQKGDGFHALTFAETEVQGVAEIDPDHSALVLRSGAEIPIRMPYEELEQKIYSPNTRTDDSAVLDLRAVTGCVASKQSSHAPASKPSSGASAKPKVPANTNKAPAPGDKMDDDARRVNNRAADAIGSIMPDGSIYAGISPDTDRPMYTTSANAPLTLTFNEAAGYAKKLNQEKYLGHDDWRVPTKGELNVLFNNRAAIGRFNVSDSTPAGWYWSATPDGRWDAWCQRFSDGAQGYNVYKNGHSSVRLVR